MQLKKLANEQDENVFDTHKDIIEAQNRRFICVKADLADWMSVSGLDNAKYEKDTAWTLYTHLLMWFTQTNLKPCVDQYVYLTVITLVLVLVYLISL